MISGPDLRVISDPTRHATFRRSRRCSCDPSSGPCRWRDPAAGRVLLGSAQRQGSASWRWRQCEWSTTSPLRSRGRHNLEAKCGMPAVASGPLPSRPLPPCSYDCCSECCGSYDLRLCGGEFQVRFDLILSFEARRQARPPVPREP